VLQGSVDEYTPAIQDAMVVAFTAGLVAALPAGSPAPNVTLTITAASVKAEFSVVSDNDVLASTYTTAMSTAFSDLASVQNTIGAAAGVQVLAPPLLTNTYVVLKDGRPSGLSAGAIAGIVIGVLIGVLLMVGVGYYYMKKKKAAKTTYPA